MTPLDAQAARRVCEFERFASWCVRRFLSRYKIPPHAAVDGADLHARVVLIENAECVALRPNLEAYLD